MRLLKRVAAAALTGAALLTAGQAQADQSWAWSYAGTGVTASGTFTTAGNAAVAEDILSFTGTRNGLNITGLVPLETDPDFLYDNQFAAAAPHFTEGGIVFEVAGLGNVNVYFFEGQTWDLRVVDGVPIEGPITFNVTAVPEAATLAYMGLGLAGIAFAARRTRRKEEQAETV